MRRQVSSSANLSGGDRLIYVIGCNHGIQPVDADPFDGEQVLAQRVHFRELLTELIHASDTQFVGEEWGRANYTIAHLVADKNGNIPWSNINTSHEDLDAMQIPRNYGNEVTLRSRLRNGIGSARTSSGKRSWRQKATRSGSSSFVDFSICNH